jgi:hypothetical protein
LGFGISDISDLNCPSAPFQNRKPGSLKNPNPKYANSQIPIPHPQRAFLSSLFGFAA